jgi:hypothetical protein
MSQPGSAGGGAWTLFLLCAAVSCVGAPPPPAPRQASSSDLLSVPESTKAGCSRPGMFGPVIVSREAYLSRSGVGVARFSALTTTMAKPLEECGIRPVLVRLVELTCNDRSNPFNGDVKAAHASRAGSFGPGGRCDSIIDRYDVKCPEGVYQVFADSYLCPAGQK